MYIFEVTYSILKKRAILLMTKREVAIMIIFSSGSISWGISNSVIRVGDNLSVDSSSGLNILAT